MAEASDIREHMEVRDTVGVHVGTVDHVEGDRIKLTRANAPDGQHHYVPLSAVSRVDAHVHLDQTAAALGLPVAGAAARAGAGSASPPSPVPARAVGGTGLGGNFYLPWIVGIVGLLLLLLLFKSCVDHKRTEAVAIAPVTTMGDMGSNTAMMGTGMGQTAPAPSPTPLAISGLGDYLRGPVATPSTFYFEQLHFDTGRSEVRSPDQEELKQVAAVLKQYGRSHVRIDGYADARGSDPANLKLGRERAVAVKAALVGQGIDASRIDTGSGGENDPVDTNATAGGRAENRRTELVVLAR